MTILPPRRLDALDTEQAMLWGARNPNARPNLRSRRYSVQLMDIAAQIATTKGLREAVATTGVGKWTIKKHLARLRKAGRIASSINNDGKPRRGPGGTTIFRSKYSLATMQAIMRAGIADHEATNRPLNECVRRAEKSFGVKRPGYVMNRWREGHFEI